MDNYGSDYWRHIGAVRCAIRKITEALKPLRQILGGRRYVEHYARVVSDYNSFFAGKLDATAAIWFVERSVGYEAVELTY